MARFPSGLTEEEKDLKKKFQRLREKKVQLKRSLERPQSSNSSSLLQKKDSLNPKDAKEAVRKMLASGNLKIKKIESKKCGFKRVGQSNMQESSPAKKKDGRTVERKHPKQKGDEKQLGDTHPPKPKPKPVQLPSIYKTFVRSSEQQKQLNETHIPKSKMTSEIILDATEPIDSKQDCTVCVMATQGSFTDDVIIRGLGRFNSHRKLEISIDESKKKAFVTFHNKLAADKSQLEMNEGRMSAIDIKVAKAGPLNGYVELPPELEAVPWVKQAASKESVASTTPSHTRNKMKYYDIDNEKVDIF